jgi:hypothetical protein
MTTRPLFTHPRACGGNVSCLPMLMPAVGSSPRVRGQQIGLGGEQLGRGFIPARAGATVNIMIPTERQEHGL